MLSGVGAQAAKEISGSNRINRNIAIPGDVPASVEIVK
jgi:hypothetical protein